MTFFLVVAGLSDLLVVAFTLRRVLASRRRGLSLRLRIFLALTASALAGALATGLYATAVDAETLGFSARFARVLPKGFLLASALLPVLAAVAAWVGARLARPVEALSEEAARIAEGDAGPPGTTGPLLRAGRGAEAQKLARALTSMRREIADRPYAAAFLRDAWHDLKTPVAAISATLEVLEDGALDDPEAARRFLANLRRSTGQLERRLQDLVTLSRFETAALADRVPTDLVLLVRGAIDALSPIAEARHVDVAFAPSGFGRERDARVRLDDAAVSRALGNLLENAIHASPGGTVRISVAAAGTDGVVAVEIANEPSAIPAGLRDRLFERAAIAREGGSGLGLAIARAAVEAHGGTIRFVELGPPRVAVRIELPP